MRALPRKKKCYHKLPKIEYSLYPSKISSLGGGGGGPKVENDNKTVTSFISSN